MTLAHIKKSNFYEKKFLFIHSKILSITQIYIYYRPLRINQSIQQK